MGFLGSQASTRKNIKIFFDIFLILFWRQCYLFLGLAVLFILVIIVKVRVSE
jgi:hypothetical protein